MQRSFFPDEYSIINSQEFNNYLSKDLIDAVPYVVVRDAKGAVKYAAAGVHDGTELRQIERGTGGAPAFNLKKARAAIVLTQ
jgi:hypothetical protein